MPAMVDMAGGGNEHAVVYSRLLPAPFDGPRQPDRLLHGEQRQKSKLGCFRFEPGLRFFIRGARIDAPVGSSCKSASYSSVSASSNSFSKSSRLATNGTTQGPTKAMPSLLILPVSAHRSSSAASPPAMRAPACLRGWAQRLSRPSRVNRPSLAYRSHKDCIRIDCRDTANNSPGECKCHERSTSETTEQFTRRSGIAMRCQQGIQHPRRQIENMHRPQAADRLHHPQSKYPCHARLASTAHAVDHAA